MSRCMRCGKELTRDEIGAYKKLIYRGSKEFLCLKCLASRLQVSEDLLREKIEQFRAQGCVLFR